MLRKVKVFLEMIKFEHSLFALPFAYVGALLGSVVVFHQLPTWSQIFWVTLAMVGARSAAMGLNRLIDRYIDAKNPRTANRAIPAGMLRGNEVILFIVVSFAVLFIASSQLNVLSMELLPVAVFFLVLYSYTKRFTWLCHIVLGITLGLAPLGAWVGVTGKIDGIAIVLFLSVALWSAGFDVIYACQDIEFDRKEGLYSIPSRFGVARSLHTAKLFHLATALGLASLFFITSLNWWYLAGLIISYLILFYEHAIINPKNLNRVNTAFFTMNGALSCVMFCFTMMDLVVQYLW